VISSSQRPLPENTQHSQQTDIHAPGGIIGRITVYKHLCKDKGKGHPATGENTYVHYVNISLNLPRMGNITKLYRKSEPTFFVQ